MEEFWKIFNTLKRLLPTLVALEGRQLFSVRAVVSDNKDPENLRRIKFNDPLLDNLYESEWALPLRATPSSDPMLPKPGQTVIVSYLNGDPQEPVYQLFTNNPNPAREKEDPVNDAWDDIDGNVAKTIGGNQVKVVGKDSSEVVKGNHTCSVEGTSDTLVTKDYTITLDAKSTTKVKKDMLVEVDKEYSLDVTKKIQIESGEEVTIEAGSTTIKIKSGGSIEIKGSSTKIKSRSIRLEGKSTVKSKEIAVLGAKDSRGHTIVRSGQSFF